MSPLPPLSRLSSRLAPSGIRQLEQLAAARPDLISLGPGQPDASLFPLDEAARALARATDTPGAPARYLQYGPSRGDPQLVELIVQRMRAQGVRCDASHVLVTAGSQQGLDLICQLLLDEGDTVLVQPFTYPGALQVFRARGAHVDVVPEQGGAPVASPEKLLYAMADFQNPTGALLGIDERARLVALARARGVYLVEDAPYRELAFGDLAPPPSLMQVDCGDASPDQGRTLFLGSFSKVMAPGLRAGWVVGPSEIIARLTLLRQASDLQPSTLSQAILVDLLKDGNEARVRCMKRRYEARRDALDASLRRHLTSMAHWHLPAGGFFLWVRLALPLDTRELLLRAIEHGVAYVPGSEFCLDERGSRLLRLSYSSVEPERMETAVGRLARAIHEALQASSR